LKGTGPVYIGRSI